MPPSKQAPPSTWTRLATSIVVPDGMEIGVLEKEFTTAELLGHIQLDQQASVGSCALGQTLVNVFPQAITTWAKYISEQFTC